MQKSLNNEYNELLTQFCMNTLPNNYIIFKFLKGCGYSEILIIPKQSTIRELLQVFSNQFGTLMVDTIYYITNENTKIYLTQLPHDMLLRNLVKQLEWAYSLDECIHSVRILRYGLCECECGTCL